MKRIAFTEHVRADSEWFFEFAQQVRICGQSTSVEVFVGAEARILDVNGTLDISDQIRQECDLVLASVHRFPDQADGCLAFSEVPVEEFATREYELALSFLRSGKGDVLAHPGGMSVKFGNGFPRNFLRNLMREASRRNIAIELNSAYMADIQDFCVLAEEENPTISIGSDVHNLEELGRCRTICKEFLWNS